MPSIKKAAVLVATARVTDGVNIRIRDNGTGIAPDIIDQIFDPFFTTKPPGEGTSLGLSLSYDIVTREHNSVLTMSSLEGEYSEFTVFLPDDTPTAPQAGQQETANAYNRTKTG